MHEIYSDIKFADFWEKAFQKLLETPSLNVTRTDVLVYHDSFDGELS